LTEDGAGNVLGGSKWSLGGEGGDQICLIGTPLRKQTKALESAGVLEDSANPGPEEYGDSSEGETTSDARGGGGAGVEGKEDDRELSKSLTLKGVPLDDRKNSGLLYGMWAANAVSCFGIDVQGGEEIGERSLPPWRITGVVSPAVVGGGEEELGQLLLAEDDVEEVL